MYCMICGARMPEYAAFCRNCGASMCLEQEPDSKMENSPSVSEESTKAESNQKGNMKNEDSYQPSKANGVSAIISEGKETAVDQDKESDQLSKQKSETNANQKANLSLRKIIKNIKNIPTLNILIIIAMSVIAVALIVFVFLLITD